MTTPRGMGLGELTDVIGPERVVGIPVGEVTSLAYDSRQPMGGALFFAVPGDHVDGYDYVLDAVLHGAVGVVAERETPGIDAPQLIVARTRDALADAADAWYGRPSEQLNVIGVTGTDGKTTTSYLAVAALQAGGRRPGMIGTVSVRVGDRELPNEDRNTTPEALELQGLLADMVEAGNDCVVMEATSHGLAQSRVRNCRFRVAVVTNVTSEHLEFHGTLEAYRAAKAMLVEEAPIAILNADDSAFPYFRDRAHGRIVTYAVDAPADMRAAKIDARPDGTTFTVVGPSGPARSTCSCPAPSTCTTPWRRWRSPRWRRSTPPPRPQRLARLRASRGAWSGSMSGSRSGWWSTMPTLRNPSPRCCTRCAP